MAKAIQLIVDSYVRLNNRAALEDSRCTVSDWRPT
jgi:hypothetical protein